MIIACLFLSSPKSNIIVSLAITTKNRRWGSQSGRREIKVRGTTVRFAVFVLRFLKTNLILVALRSLADRRREEKEVGGV